MKIKTNVQIQKRRGLSSIVGALIFVVLMVATFSVLGIALNTQTEIVDTNREVANTEVKKIQEKFSISVFTNATQHLTVNVDNSQGQNPVEIFTLIITNQTGPAAELAGFPTKVHNIPSDTSFIASSHTENILSTTPLVLDLAVNPGEIEFYHFKAVSSLGTIKTVNLSCSDTACGSVSSGGGDLAASLFLDGPNGINTQISTAVMFVSNTYDETITDVRPIEGWDPILCDDLWTNDDSGQTQDLVPAPETFSGCTVWPASTITLAPHGTALFRWDGTVNADIGSTFTFCSNVQGTHPVDGPIVGNGGAPTCDLLTVIDPNDCGGCGPGGEGGETIILIDDLLIKPSLFLTIPSPFGGVSAGDTDDASGVWGVQVANPLNFTIGVSKVTVTAFAPGANSNLVVFDNPLENHNVSPRYSESPGEVGSWFSGAENVLVWTNVTEPIILGPYQSETFMYRVNPFHNGADLEAVIVQTSIFSTSGSFGKAAYQTTMFDANGPQNAPIANVYLSAVVDSTDSVDIQGHRNNMKNGTSGDFIVVMADMDENNASYIKKDSEFIINVPREWGLPVMIPANTTKIYCCNSTHPAIVKHSDQSYQIIGLLNEDIGDVAANEAASMSFSTQAPEEKNERLYIMYVLGNGLTNADKSVGPLSEIILHVYGNQTGAPYNP